MFRIIPLFLFLALIVTACTPTTDNVTIDDLRSYNALSNTTGDQVTDSSGEAEVNATDSPVVLGDSTSELPDTSGPIENIPKPQPKTVETVKEGQPTPNEVHKSVVISSNGVVNGSIEIPVNSTVTWNNIDDITHEVGESSGLFSSGSINPGSSFSFKFTQEGTYTYIADGNSSHTISVK